MLIFISLSIFMAVFLVIWGLHLANTREQIKISNRLENMVNMLKENLDKPSSLHRKLELNSLLSAIGKNFTSMSFSKKIEVNLSKADILLRTDEFVGMNILTALGGGLLGLALFGTGTLTFLLVFLGAIIPGVVVWRKKMARAALLNSEIGESLMGMSNSLRAGYSFQQAMDLISRESAGPLATEYRRTLREINLGITTEQALQNLVQRGENDDLELMISAVLIQRQIGGNLAEVFDKIADTIRQRIRMQGEVKTLTAQGRISAIVLALLPIVLAGILTLMNPGYMNPMIKSTIGWFLIGGALFSETIGFIIMRKITDIQV